MSVDPAASSVTGAAVAMRQAFGQMNFGITALNQTARQQQDAVTALLGGSTDAGATGGPASDGTVTETRGRNLNIVV
ncbi:hypothetical protein [Azospirillum halopraeferens]|uniref:hypothetical protein n=1 Tax=Azospirillum halopraeferens TaxID=34010 RepID=UPI0004015C5F|nr:hypothetical protein [Azospirillum halopraeferens]